jgi:alpha-beta hydrolase superfamily lysophospholipase
LLKSSLRILLRQVLRLCLYGTVGVVLTLIVVFVVYLQSRPDLEIWDLAELDAEFTAESGITTLAEYLALEDRVFEQLEDRVYARTGPVGDDYLNRYKRGSLSDPARWTPNWNRSFEWPQEGSGGSARASVLLLHGLSDSPYSLRTLGERLHQAGAHVLGLRLPGHGTAPSGLVTVRWQDMAAATRLAVDYLVGKNPDRPLYIVGYSNGAALAVHYALAATEDPELPQADRLILISPLIGVRPAAALAVWQARLGYLLGMDKLAWNDIAPEYDPFKYGSFAVNAGDLSYQITAEIQRRLTEGSADGDLDRMPPILAFTSAVDATVLAPDLVSHLFNRLPPGNHELVVYDINRLAGIDHFLKWSPAEMIELLKQRAGRSFTLSVVTNEGSPSGEVFLRQWIPGRQGPLESPLDFQWPDGVYSLSHVALPFPPGDPLYGGEPNGPSPGVYLGDIAMRGERGVLEVSPAAMLRLRWNPFYDWQELRIKEFLSLSPGDE